MMGRHDEMRQQRLAARGPFFDAGTLQFGKLPLDPIGPELTKDVELPPSRGFRTMIGEIDDHALIDAVDRRVRFVDEAAQALG